MGMRITPLLLIPLFIMANVGGCSSSQEPYETSVARDEGGAVSPGDAMVIQATPVTDERASTEEQALSQAITTPPQPSAGTGSGAYGAPTGGPPSVVTVRTPSSAPPPPPPTYAPDMTTGGESTDSESAGMEPSEPSPSPDVAQAAPPARESRRDRRRNRREGHRRPPRAQPSSATASEPEMEEAAPMSPADGYEVDDSSYGAPVAQPQQVVRMLTAATVADVDRRQNYLGYIARHHGEASQLGLDMTRRVRFRVVDGSNRPVHDAAITITSNGAQVNGRTHADGYWDFFPGVSAPQAIDQATLLIRHGGSMSQAIVPLPQQSDGRDIFIRLPQAVATTPSLLDLAFVVDVTGSMGDELRYVNEEVVGIVNRVRASVPQVNVRVAATFYRDRSDPVPIEQIPFSTNVNGFVSQMRYVQASGGGDYPEDVNSGLAAALTTLQWSTGPAVRVLVVIADAPPQMYPDFPYTYHHAMADAGSRGIRILPVAASGSDRVVEFLFRALGAFTSTPYVYLTDDSGIGGSHMDADTDRIAVEMFSDVLTRLLISDLQGLGMHEAIEDAGYAVQ